MILPGTLSRMTAPSMVPCSSCGDENPAKAPACASCGTRLDGQRVITIVTSDWKGSTSLGERLDVESLREVQTRYFDEMRTVFEAHGGTIEKIIGDAIVVVFALADGEDKDEGQGSFRAALALGARYFDLAFMLPAGIVAGYFVGWLLARFAGLKPPDDAPTYDPADYWKAWSAAF